jgi:hypothetical protein
MRWFFWSSAWLIALTIVRPAGGIETQDAGLRPIAAGVSPQVGSPELGGLRSSISVLAYCTNPTPCLDRAWVGYCEEKARAQACWLQTCAPPRPCRITGWLEMVPSTGPTTSPCTTTAPTGGWAEKYQAEPAPTADSARPNASSKMPAPPMPDKQSRRRGVFSGLLR